MKEFICSKCGHNVLTSSNLEKPYPLKWDDGHVCSFIDVTDMSEEEIVRLYEIIDGTVKKLK